MAIRTITTTVDPLNGQTINTINGLIAADTIIGTVIRKNMCVGAYKHVQQIPVLRDYHPLILHYCQVQLQW